MRLPISAHVERPWRIHELTDDFQVLDVWALPTPGDAGDFPLLVRLLASLDPSQSPSTAVRQLFAVRERLGGVLGWDDPPSADELARSSLTGRLPADLRDAPTGPTPDALPFTPVYLLDDEWAVETLNRTVHGVLHVGWVADSAGAYRGHIAILVKPRGLLGRAYLCGIQPFRHLLVYPPLLREIGVAWRALVAEKTG